MLFDIDQCFVMHFGKSSQQRRPWISITRELCSDLKWPLAILHRQNQTKKTTPQRHDCLLIAAWLRHSGPRLDDLLPPPLSEVPRLINGIPAKSSPADIIPPTVVKSCPALFTNLTANLASLSLGEGIFFEGYKITHKNREWIDQIWTTFIT